MSNYQETRIAADGLHYKSKEGGSIFMDSSNGMTISCYKDGQQRRRGKFAMLGLDCALYKAAFGHVVNTNELATA